MCAGTVRSTYTQYIERKRKNTFWKKAAQHFRKKNNNNKKVDWICTGEATVKKANEKLDMMKAAVHENNNERIAFSTEKNTFSLIVVSMDAVIVYAHSNIYWYLVWHEPTFCCSCFFLRHSDELHNFFMPLRLFIAVFASFIVFD